MFEYQIYIGLLQCRVFCALGIFGRILESKQQQQNKDKQSGTPARENRGYPTYGAEICDMIKRNESDVGNVDFEILAKTVFKFLCFILFLALSNPS